MNTIDKALDFSLMLNTKRKKGELLYILTDENNVLRNTYLAYYSMNMIYLLDHYRNNEKINESEIIINLVI